MNGHTQSRSARASWRRFGALASDHDAAAEEAQRNLTYILNAGVGIAVDGSEAADLPRGLPAFCVTHELFEVLTGLEMYSFSEEDLQRDRYPWFLYRRLRPLALAVEHLARGILESAGLPHQGHHLSKLYQTLGSGAPWVRELQALLSQGITSDKAGELDQQVMALKGSARPADSDDLVIARTFALAIAARNLVSHRHRMLDEVPVRIMSGACARALVITWLLARRRAFFRRCHGRWVPEAPDFTT